MQLDSLACIAWILAHNLASRRVAERLGLTDYGLRVDPSDGTVRHAYADRPLADSYGVPVPAPPDSTPTG